MIFNLVFWVGLIAALAILVLWTFRWARVSPAGGPPTALEILQAQYARGEMTREQYEFKKQVIG